LITATASAALVGGAALYLAAPSAMALAVTMHQTGTTAKSHEVLYGRVVNMKGKPVAGATVLLMQQVGSRDTVVGSFQTSAKGVYRGSLTLPEHVYFVKFQALLSGHNLVGTRSIILAPGRAYDVSAKATTHAVFSMLPVGSY
jgi:hypothetical protein